MEKSLREGSEEGVVKKLGVSDSRPAPTNGGLGSYSYSKNSYYQKSFADVERNKIEDEIIERLDVKQLCCASNTICIADLGCATGPNTFSSIQNIISAIKLKHQSQCPNSPTPQFHVFFNDQIANDFNALFRSLPPEPEYFAAAAPGSFHGRLFPDASLHFVHTAYSVHWLSSLPEKLRDESSPAWNKGRIQYAGAAAEVGKAYEEQFAEDMGRFLSARAKEVVPGGIMVIITVGVADGTPVADLPFGLFFNNLAYVLKDMSKEGLVDEAQIDSFNLPIYATCPAEMTKLVREDGHFSIERMELAEPATWLKTEVDIGEWINHVRAATERTFIQHFGRNEIIHEMFERLKTKLQHFSQQINSNIHHKAQLFAVLKRRKE